MKALLYPVREGRHVYGLIDFSLGVLCQPGSLILSQFYKKQKVPNESIYYPQITQISPIQDVSNFFKIRVYLRNLRIKLFKIPVLLYWSEALPR
jgi:hypothetical protein